MSDSWRGCIFLLSVYHTTSIALPLICGCKTDSSNIHLHSMPYLDFIMHPLQISLIISSWKHQCVQKGPLISNYSASNGYWFF